MRTPAADVSLCIHASIFSLLLCLGLINLFFVSWMWWFSIEKSTCTDSYTMWSICCYSINHTDDETCLLWICMSLHVMYPGFLSMSECPSSFLFLFHFVWYRFMPHTQTCTQTQAGISMATFDFLCFMLYSLPTLRWCRLSAWDEWMIITCMCMCLSSGHWEICQSFSTLDGLLGLLYLLNFPQPPSSMLSSYLPLHYLARN